jgi:hypothetical protein
MECQISAQILLTATVPKCVDRYVGTVAAVENSDTLTTPNFRLCKWD